MIASIRKFWTGSIRRQLILGIILVHAVLMSIFVADLVGREREFLLELSKLQAIGLAKTLAANGSSWILAQDFIGIEEVINSQQDFPDLQYAMFTSLEGRVLGYSDRSQVGLYVNDDISKSLYSKALSEQQPAQILINDANLIDVAAPVIAGEELIGWARVGISRAGISDNLQYATFKGLLYTMIAILVGAVFAWVMSRGLTSGIQHIITLMHSLKQGQRELDFTLDRQDELGILSRDITDAIIKINTLDKELYNLYERTRVTLRSIGDGVITTHSDGKVEYLNPIAEKLTGWPTEEAEGRPLPEIFCIFSETSGEPVENPVTKVLREKQVVALSNHTMLQHRDGMRVSIEDSAAPIYDDEKNIVGVVLVFHDATDERLMKSRMEHQASHDALTEIWNRRAFEQKLLELQKESQQNHSSHALLYIDLDQFKVVNDTSGHVAGDELLRQVSAQIDRIIRGSDMLARLGGDEFGVLLVHCQIKQATAIAENIRNAIEDFNFVWQNRQYKVGASIGIAMINHLTHHSEVLSHADLACYNAKDKGRNQVHVFSENDEELSNRHGEMYLVNAINEALKTGRFVLYSQKIAPIIAPTPDQAEHREILVRMLAEDNSIIPPNSFIAAAERYDLMSQVDLFVIDQAFSWLEAQPKGKYRLSINLSGNSLGNNQLLSEIESKLKKTPCIASYICFEITETAAISNLRTALNFMDRLIKLGVSFSLDDFGSGLSSFGYLKNMPVATLKIDGSFVRDITTDSVDAAMVLAISQVSQKLGIKTIAEFVENEETLNLLAEYGVDYAQGYYIEKPHPLSDL